MNTVTSFSAANDGGGATEWKCVVCGYISTGEKPPKGCPRCTSPSGEFIQIADLKPFTYNGEPFDILLLNGSTHKGNNTGFMVDIAEQELTRRGVSYRRYNLNEYTINHCWCCYSIRAASCSYPCRNQDDDMHVFHQLLTNARAVIIASPINWNNLSARLKDFLDRTTCMQNLYHLNKPGMTEGKVCGILVCGHEDGAMKTALDIYLVFQQLGFILAPFGIAFRTHGSHYDTKTDAEFFKSDPLMQEHITGVVTNVVHLMYLDIEAHLKGKLVPVSE